jgi:hypothetical protein
MFVAGKDEEEFTEDEVATEDCEQPASKLRHAIIVIPHDAIVFFSIFTHPLLESILHAWIIQV